METIKKIFSPGKDKDDETLYGNNSGHPTNTEQSTHQSGGGLSGEGSHFGQTKDTSSGVAGHQGTGISSTQGTHSITTTGPHSSDLANKVDPRVDSDNSKLAGTTGAYDSRNDGLGTGQGGGLGQRDHQQHSTGVSGLGNTHSSGAQGTRTSGPHDSDLANKADPRVDSDNSKFTSSTGAYGSGNGGLGTGQSGLGNTQNLGSHGNQTSGPHSSDLANKADPRVDSDNSKFTSSSGAYGTGQSGLGNTHSSGSYGNQTSGPHSSDLVNKADPRVDSDNSKLTSPSGAYGTGQSGLGNTHSSGSYGNQTSGPHSSNLANKADPRVDSDNSKLTSSSGAYGTGQNSGLGNNQSLGSHGNQTSGPHSSDLANKADPRVDSDNSKSTGQGVTGGYAPTSGGSYHTGPSGSAVGGPHATTTANRLDPTVNTTATRLEDAHKHDPKHGGGAEEADHSHGVGGAALGAGAAGLASHQHHTNQTTGNAGLGHSTGNTSGPAPTTSGPHTNDTLNKLDPRVNANQNTSTGASGYQSGSTTNTQSGLQGSTSDDHHHGRNAALAGGAIGVGAGAAAHGSGRNDHSTTTTGHAHDSNLANRADPRVDTSGSNVVRGAGGVGSTGQHSHPHGTTTTTTTNTSTTTTGPHSSDIANKADPTVDSDRSKEHNHGRNAALAGAGVGAGAYGAHKNSEHDDKDMKKAEKEAEKDQKHAAKEHEKERRHAEKDHDKHEKKEHKGLLSFLHRDKSKKYTKEEEDDFDRQEREHNSNTSRNAALGTGAGVAGGAAYGAHHSSGHDSADVNKPLPNAPSSSNTHGTSTTSHGGHHGGPIPEAEKPAGSTLGDKLHGVERNRGIPGPTGFPDEQAKRDTDEFGNPRGSVGGQGGLNRGHDGTTTGLGLGAGSGAGALGSNDHRKEQIATASSGNQHDGGVISGGLTDRSRHGEKTTSHGSGLTGSHQSTTHGTGVGHSGTTSTQHDNTHSQGTGLTGGLGHHDNTTSSRDANYTSGTSGQQHPSGLTGNKDSLTGTSGQYDNSNTTGTSGLGEHGSTGLGDTSGRNRLHKDPPAGHPFQSQTQGALGGDNGVQNSHSGQNNY